MTEKEKSFSSAVITVDFPADRLTKKIKLELHWTVSDTLQYIWSKRLLSVSQKDVGLPIESYGLYLPPSVNASGEWMKPEEVLNFYYVKKRGCLEFKLKPIELHVQTYRGSQCFNHTFEVDYSVPIANLISRFVVHFDLSFPGREMEYALQQDNCETFLESNKSLIEQGVSFRAHVFLKKKFLNETSYTPNPKALLRKASKFFKEATLRGRNIFPLGSGNNDNSIGKDESGYFTGSSNNNNNISNEKNAAPLFKGLSFSSGSISEQSKVRIQVPPLFRKCVEYIEKYALDIEGIFRFPSNAVETQTLKRKFEEGEDFDLEKIKDSHLVCGLLKLYLRERPQPLLTFSLYSAFISAQNCGDKSARNRYLRCLIEDLPKQNFKLLQELLELLRNVLEHQNKNKMTIEDLSTAFETSIIRLDQKSLLIEDTSTIHGLVCHLISEYRALFQGTKKMEFIGVAKAHSNYENENNEELNFKKGEIIFVTEQDDSDWWTGESNGRKGLFPSSFVQMIALFKYRYSQLSEGEKNERHAKTLTNSNGNSNRKTSIILEDVPSKILPPSKTVNDNLDDIQSSNDGVSTPGICLEAELEHLKRMCEEEKKARKELEELAKQLSETIKLLQRQIEELRERNFTKCS